MKERLAQELSPNYQLVKVLGKGAFGTVVECVKSNSKIVAIKVIKKYKLNDKQKLACIKESELLSEVSHENIIRFYRVIHTESFFLIEMELLTGGTLRQSMSLKKFSEDEASNIMCQIFSGLFYLHKKGILHRDLKPENIMFQDDSHSVVKITDFGLSTKFAVGERLVDRHGTIVYMAPEQLILQQYNEPVDIWSCGIILYELLTNQHPVLVNKREDQTFIETLKKITWAFPEAFSELARDLFLRCTKVNPLERYSASLALQHPWINKLNKRVPLTALEKYRNYHEKLKVKKMVLALVFLTNLMPSFNLGLRYSEILKKPGLRRHELHNSTVSKIDFEFKKPGKRITFRNRSGYGNTLEVPDKAGTKSVSPSAGNNKRHMRISSKVPSPREMDGLRVGQRMIKGKYSINLLN